MKNNSGKTLTIFLIVIATLLISLTVIAVFFFLQEVELRKSAEINLEQMQMMESNLQNDLKEAKKQVFLLQEKNKESDEKIEGLMEDLDLEKGLREEIKKDYRQLREMFETVNKEKEQMQKDYTALEEKNAFLQKEMTSTAEKHKELQRQYEQMKKNYQPAEAAPMTEEMPAVPMTGTLQPAPQAAAQDVDLKTIVINQEPKKGTVVSVDTQTNFIIVNIGEKSGVNADSVLSVYRGDQYLGDVVVTRVLPDMAAADFLPPLKSSQVRKNDQVIIKQ